MIRDREVKEAVEWFTNELPELNNNAKVLVPLKYFEIFKKVAQSYLSAEMPEERDSCVAHKRMNEECLECMENYGFNEALRLCRLASIKSPKEE